MKRQMTWGGFTGQSWDGLISRLLDMLANTFLYGLNHFGLGFLLLDTNSPLSDMKVHLKLFSSLELPQIMPDHRGSLLPSTASPCPMHTHWIFCQYQESETVFILRWVSEAQWPHLG